MKPGPLPPAGLLGACWNKQNKRYIAQIRVNWKTHYLSSFHTAEEAHAAYLEAKRRLHADGCTI